MSPIPDDPNQAQAWISGEAPDQTIDFYIPRGNRGPTGPQGPAGPSLLVGTIETTTGPAVPGTTGPQGLTGPQGPAGGIVLGTSLGTADLNTIVTSGVYRQTNSSGADSQLVKNYPYAGGYGVLLVLETTGSADIIQEFRGQSYGGATDARGFYRRNRSNGVWSPWRFHTTQRVDQTAGRAMYLWDDINGREQLIYGDTGWRDIGASLEPEWVLPAAAPRFHIRRQGNEVTMGIRVGPAASIVGTNRSVGRKLLATFPTGFMPSTQCSYTALGTGHVNTPATSMLQIANLSTQNELWLYAVTGVWGNATADAAVVIGKWTTDTPWPTTLPGTAAGSIPNL